MTAVLIVAIATVAVVLTVVSARRALAERDAVDRHHRTLDLLGTLAGRAEEAKRPPEPPPRAGFSPPSKAPPAPEPYQPRHRKARRRHGRVPALVAGGAVALAAVTGAGLYLLARYQPGSAPPGPAAARTTSTAPPRLATTATTTATGGQPVVLVGSDSQQARYTVGRPSVNMVLVLAAPCWVEIRSALGTGPVLFAGTLQAGTRRALPTATTTGGIQVRLGNPAAVTVSVDGAALVVPRPSGTQPFTLYFQGAG